MCTQNYLAAQPGGSVTVTYPTAGNILNLLWGTVDTAAGQNILTANGFTITGQEVANSCLADFGASCATQNVFVRISTDGNFFSSFTVTDIAGAPSAFEFVPGPLATPEPGSLALLGAGILGLAGMMYRRRQ